jgi:hypothetical protein
MAGRERSVWRVIIGGREHAGLRLFYWHVRMLLVRAPLSSVRRGVFAYEA